MAERLVRTQTEGSYWLIHLNLIQPTPPSPSHCPPDGLLSIDLRINRTCSVVSLDRQGNPRQSDEFRLYQIRVPTRHFPGTMNRDQFYRAVQHWIQTIPVGFLIASEGDLVDEFTGLITERVFGTTVELQEKLTVCVDAHLQQISVEFVPFEELWEPETISDTDEENNQGLPENWVQYLRDLYAVASTEEEERSRGDCSICLDGLVSFGEEGKKNLFRSPCGHVFHGGCMAEWLRKSDSCPFCRFVVSSQSQRWS